jgi:hypothetical protein
MAKRNRTKGQTTQWPKEEGLSFFFWSLCCLSFFFWSLCCLSFCPISLGHCVVCPSSFGHCVVCPFVLFLLAIYNPFQTQHCHCKIDGVDSWNNLWIDNEQVHKTWIGFYSADNKTNTDHLATCNFQIISSWNKRQWPKEEGQTTQWPREIGQKDRVIVKRQ